MPKRTIKFFGKTADAFGCYILEDGKAVGTEYDGYPPSFLGHDGIEMEVDLETGQIQNWKKPTEEQIRELVGKGEGDVE